MNFSMGSKSKARDRRIFKPADRDRKRHFSFLLLFAKIVSISSLASCKPNSPQVMPISGTVLSCPKTKQMPIMNRIKADALLPWADRYCFSLMKNTASVILVNSMMLPNTVGSHFAMVPGMIMHRIPTTGSNIQ